MKGPFKDLPFWKSGEYQVIKERLDDLDKAGVQYCPKRARIFAPLHINTPARVVILGQDPYPDPKKATGFAFNVPVSEPIPGSLANLFEELHDDLGYAYPQHGCLLKWITQGVMLLNAIPTCEAWKSRSHEWPEYELLAEQLLAKLSKEGIVFILLGNFAQQYRKYIDEDESDVIVAPHPSPRSYHLFKGSRIFSRANELLATQGKKPINWSLADGDEQELKDADETSSLPQTSATITKASVEAADGSGISQA